MTEAYVVFSHGKESGPWGSKIAAMSELARAEGFQVGQLFSQSVTG